ncbi:hypothetical protein KKH27_02995 [bacterium]|nr:hypothetical protein [bacterium]MBU1983029.1 hypothetical protein [bacterium]
MRFPRQIIFIVGLLAGGAALAGVSTVTELKSELADYLTIRYGSLEKSPVSTGVLYDLAVPFSRIAAYDGSDTSTAITLSEWLQVTHELNRATLTGSVLPSHKEFRALGRAAARDHVHPIAILNYRYQRIRSDLSPSEVWQMEEDRIASVREDAFEEKHVFAVSTLHGWTYRGADARFQVDLSSRYFSNSDLPMDRIEINFDDGLGYRSVESKSEMSVRYASVGKKTIRVRAIQENGELLHGSFVFEVRSLDTPDPTETWQIQAHVSYNGIYASGEAYVYLSDQHSTLANPVVVAEGIDLDNSLNWDELYDLLNQENLVETLRSMGYDAVVLNYDESTTYIQANALLVAALVDTVNQVLGESVTWPLIGASMGGLTTRYALAYMETNSLPHYISTLITFDSPHHGANIPLGIQYWVDFFAGESADAELLRDALNSPAARQLLLAHFTDPPTSVAQPDPLYTAFLSELAGLGNYPATPRLVAVANGSGTMQNSGFNPGDQLILYEYRSFLVDVTGNVWALNNAQSQLIFDGEIDLIWPLPDERMSVTVQPTWPWDNAPGGMRATMAQMDSVEVPYGDLIALHPNHCFIPTISALDLAVQNPFYDIPGEPDLYALSPFDSLYFPIENQEHVLITPENYGWLVGEICGGLPAPVTVIGTIGESVQIMWSPIPGARSYRIYATENLQSWPAQYAVTADTTWIAFPPVNSVGYLRITASTDLPQ